MSSTTSNSNAFRKQTFFREYIGVKPNLNNLDNFPGIINPDIKEFHFILGIATENYIIQECGREGTISFNCRKGLGEFNRTWDIKSFSPDNIMSLKSKYSNVKVVISIGGHGNENPFNPLDVNSWINNAVESLTKIFKEFQNLIDGIDIHYDWIDTRSCNGTNTKPDCFAHCIGEVIAKLKSNNFLNIDVVSISPSEDTELHYLALYSNIRSYVDFVDYQFYHQKGLNRVDTVRQFVDLYKKVTSDYMSTKVLVGFSTDNNDNNEYERQLHTFIDGCEWLIKENGSIPGIFVWNANDSFLRNKNFILEGNLQKLLLTGKFPPS